jgi:hypothetical protein
MTCKLCGKKSLLLKRSHIIPEFAYRGLYDETHQILFGKLDNLDFSTLRFSAPYDKNILCQDCDCKIIGGYESYACNALYGGRFNLNERLSINKGIGQGGLPYLQVENINYKKFKLYILSILWKASISRHPFFKNINLGDHENIIKEMILHEEPKDFNTYTSGLILADDHDQIITRMVIEPYKVSVINTFYLFYINRLFYIINFSDTSILEILKTAGIRENNSMQIPILSGQILLDFYDSVLKRKIRKK